MATRKGPRSACECPSFLHRNHVCTWLREICTGKSLDSQYNTNSSTKDRGHLTIHISFLIIWYQKPVITPKTQHHHHSIRSHHHSVPITIALPLRCHTVVTTTNNNKPKATAAQKVSVSLADGCDDNSN